jgi:hypothetical protein
MSNLYIIGTEHWNAENLGELTQLYNKLNPDIIFSEINPHTLNVEFETEEKVKQALTEKFGVNPDYTEAKLHQLFDDLMFVEGRREGRINLEYAKKHNIQHEFLFRPKKTLNDRAIVDDINSLLRKIESSSEKELKEYITLIHSIFQETQKSQLEKHNFMAEHDKSVHNEVYFLMGRMAGDFGKRDKQMEATIRKFYDPNKVLVVTIGANHTLDSITKTTLYSRIKDLNPQIMKLNYFSK